MSSSNLCKKVITESFLKGILITLTLLQRDSFYKRNVIINNNQDHFERKMFKIFFLIYLRESNCYIITK